MLGVLKFISETGIKFEPQLRSPLLCRRHTVDEKLIII
jgi:hypothetical protein